MYKVNHHRVSLKKSVIRNRTLVLVLQGKKTDLDACLIKFNTLRKRPLNMIRQASRSLSIDSNSIECGTETTKNTCTSSTDNGAVGQQTPDEQATNFLSVECSTTEKASSQPVEEIQEPVAGVNTHVMEEYEPKESQSMDIREEVRQEPTSVNQEPIRDQLESEVPQEMPAEEPVQEMVAQQEPRSDAPEQIAERAFQVSSPQGITATEATPESSAQETVEDIPPEILQVAVEMVQHLKTEEPVLVLQEPPNEEPRQVQSDPENIHVSRSSIFKTKLWKIYIIQAGRVKNRINCSNSRRTSPSEQRSCCS